MNASRLALTSASAGTPPPPEAGWPLRDRLGRLPLPRKRVRLWALAIAAIGIVPMDTALVNGGSDWTAFWSAGATVGSSNLVNASAHEAWQRAHGLPAVVFPYPPPVAFLWWPFSLLPVWLSFIANAALMLAFVALAAWFVVRIYGLKPEVAMLLAFAWAPATAPAVIGQNTAFALILALWAIDALRRDSWLETGFAVGLMLYKPQLGLPLVGLLVLRLKYRELGLIACMVVAAYFVGVAAAAGDWRWPISWWNELRPELARDLSLNADKAITIPGLIGRIPDMPGFIPAAACAVLVLLSLRGLARAPIAEAGAAACLLAISIGPRVWGYEAGLLLPMLAWVLAGGVAEPWRTRFIVIGVPLGLTWLISPYTVVSGVALIVGIGAALWLWRWRPLGPDPVATAVAVVEGAPA